MARENELLASKEMLDRIDANMMLGAERSERRSCHLSDWLMRIPAIGAFLLFETTTVPSP